MSKRSNPATMFNHRTRIDDNEIPKYHPLANNCTRHDDAALPHGLRETEGMSRQEGHVYLTPIFLIDPAANPVVPDSDEELRRGATVQDTFLEVHDAHGAELIKDFLATLGMAPGPEYDEVRHRLPGVYLNGK